MSKGLLDPKVDFVFKNIFGSPNHPEILISFLNATLKAKKKIVNVDIKKTDIEKQYIEDKYSRLDVKATTSNDEIINIEIQLKNENNILPLNHKQKIALIGPYADNIAILGSWSMFSDKSKITTLKEAFEAKIGKENVIYAKGSEILEEREINQILQSDGGTMIHTENEEEKLTQYLKEAKEAAKQADVIVLAIG